MAKNTITERELGLIVASGLLLFIGSIWYLKGLAIAMLFLGAILLLVAYCVA